MDIREAFRRCVETLLTLDFFHDWHFLWNWWSFLFRVKFFMFISDVCLWLLKDRKLILARQLVSNVRKLHAVSSSNISYLIWVCYGWKLTSFANKFKWDVFRFLINGCVIDARERISWNIIRKGLLTSRFYKGCIF